MAFGFEPRTPLELELIKKLGKSAELLTFSERAEELRRIRGTRDKGLKNINDAQEVQKLTHKKRYGKHKSFGLGDKVFFADIRRKTRKAKKLQYTNLGPGYIVEQHSRFSFTVLHVPSASLFPRRLHIDNLSLCERAKAGLKVSIYIIG